jgi:acetyl-CoA carboxylase, biotin carboxylase subunit
VQRRHQKLVEESPAPNLPQPLRHAIHAAALALASSMNYRSAGTVEFLVDADAGDFYFLEMNTRIQVEHPVTEMVTGLDLIEQQLRIAGGEGLQIAQEDVRMQGHAIECRINAEDPDRNFQPSPGLITAWEMPRSVDVRLDTHCEPGYRVPPHYDSLLGKLIVHGSSREDALVRMRRALSSLHIAGVRTTVPFLQRVMADDAFASGAVSTRLLSRLLPAT